MTTLGEIAEIRNGATPSTQVTAYWNGSIPWCIPTDITNTLGKYLIETERNITAEGLESCPASLLPAGTLLLCSRATIGEIKIASSPVCTNQGFKSLICREEVSNEFLYYLISTLKPQIVERAIGSTFLEIGKNALASIEVKLPSSHEQRAIADALSDVDNLLQSLEVLIAKKRAIKQAAMQQLLTGKARLPGFTGPWETTQLGDLGPFSKGRGIRRDDVSDEGVPCIRYGELYTRYKDYVVKPVTRIPLTVASESLPIKTGALLFAGSGETSGEIGRCAAYLGTEQAYVGGDVVVLTPLSQSSLYLGYLMNHPAVTAQKSRMAQGDAVVHISSRNLAQIQIDLPPLEEQTAIAAILSDMDTEISALEQRRDKTRALKQGMMQQLLTGRVRLPASDKAARPRERSPSIGKGHNWQFNEAVVISVLVEHFGSAQYPLGRKRSTKLSYLLHRHCEGRAEGYLKKAAGPYNPRTRYGGPEKIALQKEYVRKRKRGNFQGLVAGPQSAEAASYFNKWYGKESVEWLEQFRRRSNDALELLTTVDMAVEELRGAGRAISMSSVKEILRHDTEWQAKLTRTIFSDANLDRAIVESRRLFSLNEERQTS